MVENEDWCITGRCQTLYDMAGNVWQWCSDRYRPDTYARRAIAGIITRNPQGSSKSESYDPQGPEVLKRVQRGGSFLCSDQYCMRYVLGARGKGAPNTGSNHLGFRWILPADARAAGDADLLQKPLRDRATIFTVKSSAKLSLRPGLASTRSDFVPIWSRRDQVHFVDSPDHMRLKMNRPTFGSSTYQPRKESYG